MEQKADDIGEIVRELRSNEPLPVCPYDRRSPDYFTAPVDKPCVVCGTINDPDAPDLCRGADTRIMKKAADALERLSERCEAYKGQVKAGAEEIGRLNAERDGLLQRAKATDEKIDRLTDARDWAVARAEAAETERDEFAKVLASPLADQVVEYGERAETAEAKEREANVRADAYCDTMKALEKQVEAAETRLKEALEVIQFASDGYGNQDVNHAAYRLGVYLAAQKFLEKAHG